MSIYKDGKLIAGGRQCMSLLSFMWADHVLNDASWLRADTFSWQNGSVYQAAYQHLADDILGKTLQSETISGTTIQFYLSDDGHKICPASEESNVASIYSATGVAWYYIIDTVNQRFKLPRTKFGFTGIRSGVGGYVEPGLPNITGSFRGNLNAWEFSGSFYDTGYQIWYGDNIHRYSPGGIGIDASKSSSIYGNSNTVQPPATQMYLYFYVGSFTQTAVENTAGLNAELFNNKLDRDMSNMNASQTAKETVVGWGMPDYSAVVSMTSGSAAPKNGWAVSHGVNGNVTYSVNGVSVAQGDWQSNNWSGNWNLQIMVSAGDVVTGGSWKFIPCKGVN